MGAVRLGDLLVRMGVLTQAELDHAISLRARHDLRLGQILVDHGMVSEDRVMEALTRVSGLPRLDLKHVVIDPAAHRWTTKEWAEQHMAVPISIDRVARTMTVLVSDPTDVAPLDELAFRSGLKVSAVLGSDREVMHVHRHLFGGAELVRDRRAAPRQGPSAPARAPGGDQPELLRGNDAMMEHLQRASGAPATTGMALAPEAATATDTALVPRLRALMDAQQESARELQVLFELCVARGIIHRHEYLERLQRDDGT